MDFNDLIFPVLSIGGLGLIFGIVLGFASKKFHVPVDERVPLVRDCLPSANCGGCGFAGCDAFAQAVVDGDAPANGCTVGGKAVTDAIGEALGITVDAAARTTAFVKCVGTCDAAKRDGIYYGDMDCNQAVTIPGGGNKSCSYGCLGLGSCVKVCAYGALYIEDGVAKVDDSKCTACGMCVGSCPKGLIDIKPVAEKIRVYCNSKDKLKEVTKVCSAGCFSCGICVKNCPEGAITMVNNTPMVDQEKCTLCMVCTEKCPVKVIRLHEAE